ncbi:MAG: hypothetical protein R3C05_09295 [Pirellulaceae bacterium]
MNDGDKFSHFETAGLTALTIIITFFGRLVLLRCVAWRAECLASENYRIFDHFPPPGDGRRDYPQSPIVSAIWLGPLFGYSLFRNCSLVLRELRAPGVAFPVVKCNDEGHRHMVGKDSCVAGITRK